MVNAEGRIGVKSAICAPCLTNGKARRFVNLVEFEALDQARERAGVMARVRDRVRGILSRSR